MRNLHIIVSSVRPGRGGIGVANWVLDLASGDARFNPRLVDLKAIALPMHDETGHPRHGTYEHAHTRDWSRTIGAADAFVIVTPEYNHSYPAALKNALDYLSAEWRDKPVGMVSYGGVSGGLRAVAHLKPVLAVLGMVPLNQGVVAPFYSQQCDENGAFRGTALQQEAALGMLDGLSLWCERFAAP